MKIYSILLILGIMVMFDGCCYDKPEPIIKTVVVTKIKEVKVPVPCQVPKIDCSFKGTGFTPTYKLLECVTKQKRVLETISKNNSTLE